jgi:ribose/xylose/arabinose/galactoside ABC-type transport system permease subunit
MTSQKKIQIMKTICWIGVVADAPWTIALVFPQFYGILTGKPDLEVDLSLRMALGIAGALMAGWTLLLAWTAKNPVERRVVMALTAVPVIAGLLAVALIGVINGSTSTTWILVKCGFLSIAMLWGYHSANSIAKENTHEINH